MLLTVRCTVHQRNYQTYKIAITAHQLLFLICIDLFALSRWLGEATASTVWLTRADRGLSDEPLPPPGRHTVAAHLAHFQCIIAATANESRSALRHNGRLLIG